MTYRLLYWKKRGRAEQIRLLLNELGAEYEDVPVAPGEEFRKLQAEGPEKLYFGSVPMLEDGAFRLCQAPVILSYIARKHAIAPTNLELASKADAIVLGAEDLRMRYFSLFGAAKEKQAKFVQGDWSTRWRPSFEGLLAIGCGEYFVGGALTHADIAVWDVLDSISTWIEGATLEGYPNLQRFQRAIATRPRIASYLGSERRVKG